MKRFLGIILILVAIIGGLYFGGWLLLIKGIVDISESVKANREFAISLATISLGVPVITGIAFVLILLGINCIDND